MVCLEQVFCVIIKQNLASFSKLKKKKNLFLLRNLEFCVFKFMKVSVVLFVTLSLATARKILGVFP